MELDSWCICGKQVFDSNALYCSSECAASDNKSQSISNKSLPQPPINLHFSITITPNIYKASDSNAIVLSSPSSMSSSYTDSGSSFTSICTLDQNFNENYNYVYTCNHYKFREDVANDDYYTSYYSTSNPIDIPSPRTQAASDPALEPNKGTFGKESILNDRVPLF